MEAVYRVTVQEVDGCSGYCCPSGNSYTPPPASHLLLPLTQHALLGWRLPPIQDTVMGFTLTHALAEAGLRG